MDSQNSPSAPLPPGAALPLGLLLALVEGALLLP